MEHRAKDGSAEPREWLQALFSESPLAIGFSRDGVTLDANPAYVRLFGYESAAELRGTSILEQIAASHRERIVEMIADRARGVPIAARYQTRGLRKDGTEFPFEIATTRVVVGDGPLTIAFISDVSERDQAVSARTASEECFRLLAAAAVEGVFIHAEGKIVLANDAGAAMYGYDRGAIVGVPLAELAAPESRSLVAEHVRRGTTEPYEGIARRKDGSLFVAEVRGRTLSFEGRTMRVSIIRDITDRKRREAEQIALTERVRQAQKLESLGVLAGGVAHDFNNILTVISNEVALAKGEAGVGTAASLAHLDAIALAAERASDLCRQMLAYAGKAQLEREALDVSHLVGEMASMLEASIARKASLVRELAPTLPSLLGDATQLRQVVMNLVINASEAISGGRGTIRVSTGMGTYDAAAFPRSLALGEPKPGAYVWLEVEDNGAGMDAATVAQMFDPFFTTKFAGRGLGMAAVAGIVRGHGGAIDVASTPGQGTRIRVFLPASSTAPAAIAPPPARAPRANGVVLLVDDENNVRTSTERLLRTLGFEVLTACDGVEALELFEAERARIDVVLLDLTMPRMNGIECLQGLRRIAPGIPVVLTSGYGAERLEDEASQREHPDAVLAKPYTMDRLLSTLQQVMPH